MKELLIHFAIFSAGACTGLIVACFLMVAKQSDERIPANAGELDCMLDEPIGGQIDKRV